MTRLRVQWKTNPRSSKVSNFSISREQFADSVFDLLCHFLILSKTGNPATQFSSHVFMFMQMCFSVSLINFFVSQSVFLRIFA